MVDWRHESNRERSFSSFGHETLARYAARLAAAALGASLLRSAAASGETTAMPIETSQLS